MPEKSKRTPQVRRQRRKARVRSRIFGTATRPRLAVFRSGQHIYAQVIDDEAGKTLVSASSVKTSSKEHKQVKSAEVGASIARLCAEKGILTVVFDRGGYLYHGRVKSLAEGAREGGLKF